MLERNLIHVIKARRSYPKMHGITLGIEALPETEQESLLPRTLLNALSRSTTASILAVSEAVREQCDIDTHVRPELSMVRYISWAIPSIGFIGTVRGIGDAFGRPWLKATFQV